MYPILIGLIFYFLISATLFIYTKDLVQYIMAPYLPDKLPEIDEGFFSFLNFLKGVSVYGAIGILIGLLIFLLFTKISKYIILIMLSPIFSLLSERTEEILTKKQYPFQIGQFIKDILRGTLIAIRNLVLEMGIIGILGIIGIFSGPLAIVITPLIWVIGAYFYGFSMIDYVCERRKLSILEGVRLIRKRRFLAIGNGGMYSIIEMIPIIGIIVAPINAVVGACTGLIEVEEGERSSESVTR